MAKAVLPTNFKDDVLDSSMNGKRRYVLIQNSDGTYSLDDATQYTQVGSTFGQAQINATNKAVNDSVDKAVVIDNISDIAANNTSGKVAGALALKELNRDLTYFYGGGNEIDIKSYIRTHITAQNVPSGRSPKSFHLRNDNGDVNLIGSAINIGNDAFTGFFVDFNTGDAYSFKKWGADPVIKKLGSFQRKLLGRVTSSTTFDCKSIPGWEDFTENNFAIIPVKIDATGGQWKSGATGAGGAQQGGCTPTLSYDKVNGILKVSNFSWNNDYAYGSYWTNYCHGNMTADVYCYHF